MYLANNPNRQQPSNNVLKPSLVCAAIIFPIALRLAIIGVLIFKAYGFFGRFRPVQVGLAGYSERVRRKRGRHRVCYRAGMTLSEQT